jgi:hypothetical protein
MKPVQAKEILKRQDNSITIFLFPKEKEQIKKESSAASLSVSSYARLVLLGKIKTGGQNVDGQ